MASVFENVPILLQSLESAIGIEERRTRGMDGMEGQFDGEMGENLRFSRDAAARTEESITFV
jgi:hypothetical protein